MQSSDSDGRFPEDTRVLVRYPRNKQEARSDRSAWPWLPGSILEQCGPDEWSVCVEVPELATLTDGRPASAGTADDDRWYPTCYRDSGEIRPRQTGQA